MENDYKDKLQSGAKKEFSYILDIEQSECKINTPLIMELACAKQPNDDNELRDLYYFNLWTTRPKTEYEYFLEQNGKAIDDKSAVMKIKYKCMSDAKKQALRNELNSSENSIVSELVSSASFDYNSKNNKLYCAEIRTDANYRGQGAGKLVMDSMITLSKAVGLDGVYLDAHPLETIKPTYKFDLDGKDKKIYEISKTQENVVSSMALLKTYENMGGTIRYKSEDSIVFVDFDDSAIKSNINIPAEVCDVFAKSVGKDMER